VRGPDQPAFCNIANEAAPRLGYPDRDSCACHPQIAKSYPYNSAAYKVLVPAS